MVRHGLLLCKLWNAQNYSDGAGILVGLNLGERAQFVWSGGQESSVGAVTCEVSQGSVGSVLVRPGLYHLLTTTQGLSGLAVFTFMGMICRLITLVLCQIFKCVLMSWTWICSVCMNGRLRMVFSCSMVYLWFSQSLIFCIRLGFTNETIFVLHVFGWGSLKLPSNI
jgi:hypothetical protein